MPYERATLVLPSCVDLSDRLYVVEGPQRRLKIKVTCPDCGEPRYVRRGDIDRLLKSGSFTGRCLECNGKLRGPASSNWRGGRHVRPSAFYVYVAVMPDHPFYSMANSHQEIAEHRLVMATELRRPLRDDEHVHHIDGNRLNNARSNLAVMSKSAHSKEHHRLNRLIRKEKNQFLTPTSIHA